MTIAAQPGGSYIDADVSADLAAAALDMARRFHNGATLWVISPQWEPHAHHVAVEFVHPVIMGKRALPSVALVDPDPVAQARVASQPGDLLIAVASADEPAVIDAMRRAQAWGVLTLWIGSGPRPQAGAANHILWIDSDDPMVPATGTFVLLYHLLWELTHVCFEHPGLLKPDADECTDEVCVTCSDEGRLGEVLVEPADATSSALVRTAAGEEWVDVTMLGDVAPNDLVLVHAGSGDHPAGRHRSGGAPMTESENTGFLYPFIESEETDATSLLDDLAASARGKAAESARLQGESLDEYRDALTRRGNRDGRAIPPGRTAVHIRQRRQFHRRRDAGIAVQPACARPSGRGVVAGRRQRRGDRARQRCRIRSDLQAPDHRPRPRAGHRDRVVDVGQLGGSDDGDHRGEAARPADDRLLRT